MLKLFKVFLVGFLVNLIYLLFYRVLNVKFPLNIIGVFLSTFSLFGLSLGALLILANKNYLLLKGEKYFAVLIGIWLFTLIFNKGVPFHFFISNLYYQYPAPQLFFLRLLFLFLFLFLSIIPFIYLGMKFADYFVSLNNPDPADIFSIYLLGFILSYLSAYFLILKAGAYLSLIIGSILILILFENKKITLAGVIVFLLILTVGIKEKDVFFLWSVKKYKMLYSFWSPYYKLNFVSFNKDRCLGGVYNNLMTWYTCNEVKLLPKEAIEIAGSVSKGKENVLVIGRTDGVYPQIIRDKDKNLKKLKAVEFDMTTPKLMKTKFAKYNNYIFKEKYADTDFVNLSYFLKESKEKYDLIFYDGIGIRLFLLPKTMIFMEDFLLSKEFLNFIFNKHLSKKGVLVLDWGSAKKNEALWFTKNIPPGIHFKVYWATITNFPFFGLPIFFVIASKDENELQRIAADLNYNRNIKPVVLKEMNNYKPYSINTPFLQDALIFVLLTLSLVFFLPAMFILRIFLKSYFKKATKDENLFKYFFYLGILFSFTEIVLISRNSIYLNFDIPLNFSLLSMVFFGGYFAGMLVFKKVSPKPYFIIIPVFLFIVLYLSTFFNEYLIIVCNFLGGLLIAFFFSNPLQFIAKENRAIVYFGKTLGIALGIYFFQFIIYIAGYKLTALFTSFFYLLFSLNFKKIFIKPN